MEIKKSLIFSASKGKFAGSSLENSYMRLKCGDKKCYSLYKEDNSESLAKIYNQAIDHALKETKNVDCLILVHDDVILEEDPIPKLEKLFDEFDVIGVAGTSKIELKSPALWHLMGGGFSGGNLHGCVQHMRAACGYVAVENVWMTKFPTNFGPYPHRAVMIDGVFMALNRKAMETVRFDESNPCGFHFYDLDFSLNAHLNGLKVGVGDILITHESPGLREFTEDWRSGEKWFLNKYAGSN
jgi:GT2 family glycosyltransferase